MGMVALYIASMDSATHVERPPLTKRQEDVLRYVEDFIRRHGYSPSMREIGAGVGIGPTSANTAAFQHVRALVKKGYMRKLPKHSRAISVVPDAGTCPHCGRPLGATS